MRISTITKYAFSRADRASIQLHHLPGTSAAPGSQQDLAMARQFFVGGNFKLNPVNREQKRALVKTLNDATLDSQTGKSQGNFRWL